MFFFIIYMNSTDYVELSMAIFFQPTLVISWANRMVTLRRNLKKREQDQQNLVLAYLHPLAVLPSPPPCRLAQLPLRHPLRALEPVRESTGWVRINLCIIIIHRKNMDEMCQIEIKLNIYIYIYSFSRRFYPKRLTSEE